MTRFLSEHLVRVGPSVWSEHIAHSLEFHAPETPDTVFGLSASYVFSGPGCLFVGGSEYSSPELKFALPAGVVANVMLSWDPRTGGGPIAVMATHDATISVNPAGLVQRLDVVAQQFEAVELELLAGLTVKVPRVATRVG